MYGHLFSTKLSTSSLNPEEVQSELPFFKQYIKIWLWGAKAEFVSQQGPVYTWRKCGLWERLKPSRSYMQIFKPNEVGSAQ